MSFLPQSLLVRYDGEERLRLALYGKLDVDGSTWTKDGDTLVLTLQKLDAGISWPRWV